MAGDDSAPPPPQFVTVFFMHEMPFNDVLMMTLLSVFSSGQFLLIVFVALMVVLLWRRQSRIIKMLQSKRDGE